MCVCDKCDHACGHQMVTPANDFDIYQERRQRCSAQREPSGPFLLMGGLSMIRCTEEFRAVVKAARRVGTPLLAVRTADPASAITQVCAGAIGKNGSPPVLVWDFGSGLQGRNDAGKAAVAKVLGENSHALG